MASCSCIVARADANLCFPTKRPCISSLTAATAAASRLQNKGLDVRSLPRGRSQKLRVQAVANTSRRRRSSSDDVVMVDPLEAKRLAAQQMQEIQAKQKLKRQRRIEAINGAWAVIGLTAGLVAEVQTGDSIPAQLARYWSAIVSQFWQW